MNSFFVLACVLFLCYGYEESREPKFFFGNKQQTVVLYRKVSEYVTEFTPSSCIVVEPTLPPCRHVRNLEIIPSASTSISKTEIPQISKRQAVDQPNWNPVPSTVGPTRNIPTPPLRSKPPKVKNHPHFWNWQFLNPFRTENITYTATKTEYITTKVEDTNTVVSFYIKGCRPSRLPFNLTECDKPLEESEKSIVIMAPLKFVPNLGLPIAPSTTESKEMEAEGDVNLEDGDYKNETKSDDYVSL